MAVVVTGTSLFAHRTVYDIWLSVIPGRFLQLSSNPNPPPSQSLTHLPDPTSEFIFPLQQKEGPSWPFIFQFRAFFSSYFFADKCSPIHPDRCHIASLPFWYIASDPATCNKKAAPGTPFPRQCSDTGYYLKGASLMVLSGKPFLLDSMSIYTFGKNCGISLFLVKERQHNMLRTCRCSWVAIYCMLHLFTYCVW